MSEIPPYRPDPLATGYSPAPEGAPDREHDHHVSFPDHPAPTPTATQSGRPTAATTGVPSRSYPSYQSSGPQSPPPKTLLRAGGGPGVPNPSPQPASTGRLRSRQRRGVVIALIAVVIAVVAVGLAVGVLLAGGSDRGDEPSPKADRPTTVPNSPLAVDPTPVPRLTPDVRSVRFDVQGTGRADIRIYRDGASQQIKDVALPYAVSVPVGDERSPYLTISATDYERTDSMRCTATAGEEVVSVNVGTRRVECAVTSSSLPTSSGKP